MSAGGSSRSPDVLVVGAGAIGLGCAYELAGSGLRVTVIDRAEPGGEASGASAGILSAFAGDRAGPMEALARLSRDLYGPLAEALRGESGVDVQYERGGHLELCMSEAEARAARRIAGEPAYAGERPAFVDATELRRLEPAVTPEAMGALFLPLNGWLSNTRLVAALVRAGARRGVEFRLGDPVEAVLREGGRVAGVRTRHRGKLEAGVVLVAAGAWGGTIEGMPRELRLRPVKGQMVALGDTPPRIHHVLFRNHGYLVPRADGECLVGATVEDGVDDKTVTATGLRELLDAALGTAPGLAGAPFRRAWAGLRPATSDGLPAVGPWPGLPGLLVATGHYRNGILLMPVTARIIREWVVDGGCGLPASVAFLPDRLLGPSRD